MKYIEIDSHGKKIQFTTRSAYIDGKEYPYSQMSSVRYSLEKKIYAFKCGDEVQYIHYEEKDEKALNAIFSQIRKMHQKRDAVQAAVPSTGHAFSVADVMDGKDVPASDLASKFTTRISVQDLLNAQMAEAEKAKGAASSAANAAEAAPAETAAQSAVDATEAAAKETTAAGEAAEVGAAAGQAAEAAEVSTAAGEAAEAAAEVSTAAGEAAEAAAEKKAEETGAEAKADAKAEAKAAAEDAKAQAKAAAEEAKAKAKEEKERLRAEKEKAKQEKAAAKAKAKEEKAKAKQEMAAAAGTTTTDKQSRFKKAIIIFIVVLLFFVAAGCVWYATVGLSSSPSAGPNSTESQSYDDIDQMIQDLEE